MFREYVGERVAKALGYQFVNNEIIQYVSILTSTPEHVVKGFDEDYHSNLSAILSKYIDLNIFSDIIKDDPYVKCSTPECIEIPEEESLFDEGSNTTQFLIVNLSRKWWKGLFLSWPKRGCRHYRQRCPMYPERSSQHFSRETVCPI